MLSWLFRKKKQPSHSTRLDYLKDLLQRFSVERFSTVHDGTVSIKLITVCSPRVSSFCSHVADVEKIVRLREIVVPGQLEGFVEQQVLLGDFFKRTVGGVKIYEETQKWVPSMLLSVERFICLYSELEKSADETDRYNMNLLNRMLKNIIDMLEGFDEYL